MKYRKEALVLSVGFALVLALILNLSTPGIKRELASANDLPQAQTVQSETKQAALRVEEEQEHQSNMLTKFKNDYARLGQTKKCLVTQNCNIKNLEDHDYDFLVHRDISYLLRSLRPQLVSNWFRLNAKVKEQVLSSIKLKDISIKTEILDLLLALNLNESSPYLSLVLDEVIDNDNSKAALELAPKAFEFLHKTLTPENEIKVAKRVARAILLASPDSSQAMSREVTLIITPNTAEIFKEVLSSLPKSALETEFLTSGL